MYDSAMLSTELKSIIRTIPQLSEVSFEDMRIEKMGGWSHHNYKITAGDRCYALRVPGSGVGQQLVDFSNEQFNTNLMQEAGIYTEVLYFADNGVRLTVFLEGEALTPTDYADTHIRQQVMDLMRKLHQCTQPFVNIVQPVREIATLYGRAVEHGYSQVALLQKIYPEIERLCHRVDKQSVCCVPAHNDISAENIIKTPHGLRLIDWEYSGNNDPYWDVAYTLVEMLEDAEEKLALLTRYCGETPTPAVQQHVASCEILADYLAALWATFELHNPNSPTTQDVLQAYFNRRFARCARKLV